MQTIKTIIINKINLELKPSHLEVINESHLHSVPDGSETHFKCVIISDRFSQLSLIKRHQWIYQILNEELTTNIHALSLHTFTEHEWLAKQKLTSKTPNCKGGFDK